MTLDQLVERKLNELAEPYSRALLQGGVKSFEEYWKVYGALEGINLARREIMPLLREEVIED